MAGRGRPTTSLTHEQMASLGLVGKDLSQAITAPPPVFPTLMSKPVPLDSSAARNYKILWKEDFISFLKDSPYFTHPTVEAESKVQRYSDKYVTPSKREQFGGDFAWSRLPAELRPNWKRKAAAAAGTNGTTNKRAKARSAHTDGRSVEEKLNALEAKENGSAVAGAAGDGDAATKKPTDSDDDEEADDEVAGDEQDEEMDEENDYGNSYFDNGDAYNEEDDNLDDGPVY